MNQPASGLAAGPAAVPRRAPITACVVTYNRRDVIGTCLAPLGFADEVIVIDKSSTDGTAEIAAGLADRVIQVPWSPTVEETRAFAIAQCRHDWILLLDDDECFSAEAILFIDAELRSPRAEIYRFPLRHYILGQHDERAYYWPERHVRLFRREAVAFSGTVHGGMTLRSENLYDVPVEGGACIHHFTHADATQWIEKTNRYTSRPERVSISPGEQDLVEFAHAAIDRWAARTPAPGPDGYPQAVAVLRAVYDIVDGLKTWEATRDQTGAAMFAGHCRRLEENYRTSLAHLARPMGAGAGAPDRLRHRLARLFGGGRPRATP